MVVAATRRQPATPLRSRRYGLLLGALGAGAILGAIILPRFRARLSTNAMLAAASVAFAAVFAIVVLINNTILVFIALLPAGVAWIAVLSTFNAELQLFLPAWVRARGLSVCQMVLFGSLAFGALLWGGIATPLGIVPAFLIAAAVMLAGAATIRRWPLFDTAGMDRSTVSYWPEPNLVPEAEPESGPVVLQTVYTIAPEPEEAFVKAMVLVRLSRLRTGASRWGLFRDGEAVRKSVEFFVLPSWEEHLRQHTDRLTAFDRDVEERANAYSDPPAETSHFIAVDLDD